MYQTHFTDEKNPGMGKEAGKFVPVHNVRVNRRAGIQRQIYQVSIPCTIISAFITALLAWHHISLFTVHLVQQSAFPHLDHCGSSVNTNQITEFNFPHQLPLKVMVETLGIVPYLKCKTKGNHCFMIWFLFGSCNHNWSDTSYPRLVLVTARQGLSLLGQP